MADRREINYSLEEHIGYGGFIALVVAIPTFLASWAYAVYDYGFLLGVGIGWIPAFFSRLL